MNGTEEQQVHLIQTYEKYLELCDELQEDPDEGPSLPGLRYIHTPETCSSHTEPGETG